MGFFDLFSRNKKNAVIPLVTSPLTGMALIQAFTTVDEPKLVDFPKDKYKVYWEIYVDAVAGGYGALIRFYEFNSGGLVAEHTVARQSVQELKQEVNALILDTMLKNKR